MKTETNVKRTGASCGICGAAVEHPQRYCSECGTSIDWEKASPAPPPANRVHPLTVWKTSTGFTLLGIFAGLLAPFLLGILALLVIFPLTVLGLPPTYQAVVYIIIFAIFPVFSLVYALRILPSYFEANPLLSSSKVISFLNGLFGGAIFGCWWNGNLTGKRKDSSHLVFAALILIVISIAAYRVLS